MYYGFETSDEAAAIGALLVYAIYKSRDVKRFKVTPDMWGVIERAVKSSSKRALDLNDFIEKLKPKLACSTIRPSAMATSQNTVTMVVNPVTGELIQKQDQGRREFWVHILEQADHRLVLERLYKRTSLIIALVRERLERERKLVEAGLIPDEPPTEDDFEEDDNYAAQW